MPRGDFVRVVHAANLTVKAVSAQFGIPIRIAQNWAWRGRARVLKVARRGLSRPIYLFHPDDVPALVERYLAYQQRPRKAVRLTHKATSCDRMVLAGREVVCHDQILVAAATPGAALTPADRAELERRREMFRRYLERAS